MSLFVWFLARDNELSRIDAVLLLIAFAFVAAAVMRLSRREPVSGQPMSPAKPGLGLLASAVLLAGVAGLLVGAALVRDRWRASTRRPARGVTVALTAIVPGITVRARRCCRRHARRGRGRRHPRRRGRRVDHQPVADAGSDRGGGADAGRARRC